MQIGALMIITRSKEAVSLVHSKFNFITRAIKRPVINKRITVHSSRSFWLLSRAPFNDAPTINQSFVTYYSCFAITRRIQCIPFEIV